MTVTGRVIDCMCTCALSKSIHALTGEFGIVYKGYIGKDSALDIAAIKTLKGIDHYNFIQCIIFQKDLYNKLLSRYITVYNLLYRIL